MIAADKIALAVRRVFRVMREQYRGGRERFMGWAPQLKDELVPPLAAAVLAGLRLGRGKAGDSDAGRIHSAHLRELGTDGAAAAQQRAIEVARSILSTTNEWIEQGRDEESIFGAARSVMIGATEGKWAESMGFTLAVQHRKKKLRWVTKGNPPCAACKKLAGKVVKAGQPFTHTKEGQPVHHPGLHPSCYCVVEEA